MSKVYLSSLDKNEENLMIKKFLSLKEKYWSSGRIIDKCLICENSNLDKFASDIVRLANTKLYIEDEDLFLQQCSDCGHVTTSYLYPNEYYFEYLNTFYGVVPSIIASDMEQKAKFRLDVLRRYLETTGKEINSVLELSSYDGVTLNHLEKNLKKKIFSFKRNVEVFGIEPTTAAVSFAENVFVNLKNKMVNKLAEQVDYAQFNIQFDAVITSYAMRMMSNPSAVIDAIKDHLSHKGVFLVHEGSFVNTTNTLNQEHQYYRQFSQQKVNYFTIQGLKFFMQKKGFEHFEGITHDASNLQGSMQTFIHSGNSVIDEDLLKTSKMISDVCIQNWKTLQKDEKRFHHYLRTVG